MAYCASRFRTIRRPTREVMVGAVGVGGANPLRLQSMTTSDTQDIAATVRQCIALAEVGCEIVRVTAPSLSDARCLRDIRAQFSAAGFAQVPLVADIHFLPATAMEAVEHVEKVRVNPGNYADRKKFAVREYSDAEYDRELQRLHEAFSPLVLRCRELGRAMRIGTNHGSLSDRIMNRYGDTPLGMVESALEFLRIAESHGYRELILSMKASNPKVMVQAYRLLVERMAAENMHYPLHLGVTEAGDGEDGRIKSAIGIGTLLLDGLGDTIRVSLTEDSVYEIPVARALADKAMALWQRSDERRVTSDECDRIDPFHFSRREITPVELGPNAPVSIEHPPRVIVSAGELSAQPDALVAAVRAARPKLKDTPLEGVLVTAAFADDVRHAPELARALQDDIACLIVALPAGAGIESFGDTPLPRAPRLAVVQKFGAGEQKQLLRFIDEASARGILPIVALDAAAAPSVGPALAQAGAVAASGDPTVGIAGSAAASSVGLSLAQADTDFVGPSLAKAGAVAASGDPTAEISVSAAFAASGDATDGTAASAACIVTLAPPAGEFTGGEHAVGAWRQLAEALRTHGIRAPLWIRNTATTAIQHEASFLSRLLEASVLTGALLVDGIGDLVSIETETNLERATKLAYNVLQGAGARISKTEFVACPSCGRTLFDLQTTTQRIRAQTGHLKGVKIAIMGCIVNGPGEMADADFGYVGGAPGKINLYVGKNCVEYGIPAGEADQRLIALIKAHGKWFAPEAEPGAAAVATVAGC